MHATSLRSISAGTVAREKNESSFELTVLEPKLAEERRSLKFFSSALAAVAACDRLVDADAGHYWSRRPRSRILVGVRRERGAGRVERASPQARSSTYDGTRSGPCSWGRQGCLELLPKSPQRIPEDTCREGFRNYQKVKAEMHRENMT